MKHPTSGGWIGASLLRKEDARFLRGAGLFVADMVMPGLLDVAFVRSPVAHGRLRRIVKPDDAAARVFGLADLGAVAILEAGPELAAFRHSPYPALADDRVRYVGQTVAACIGASRAEGEDLAARVVLEIDELDAVTDCVDAM